ncbi:MULTISPECIES: DUF3810 domain-containing protein [unclassified Clostridium]|uniref:DUF3810 domain-containing protein n=1 Tax=unclassified Clostridium TaxID=2614128 RepID=UPI0002981978|nr:MULTISPECIES: DUF3810 domain-containing protein [unclassified Clostridium]EKQ56631.1 MAG: hypothetical protein A370_01706 [Clostridium sp. Maddingley MBC34-26]
MRNLSNIEKRFSKKRKLIFSCILLGVSFILYLMSRYINGFANLYYKFVYTALVNTLARGLSIFPFSVYEMILCGFVVFILIRIIRYMYLIITKRLSIKEMILRSTNNFLLYISMFTFLNIVTLSVNCFRSDFISLTGLKIEDSSEEKLIELCSHIKDKLNELDGKINKDEHGLLKLDKNVKEEGKDAMNAIGEIYPSLKGYYPNPKPYIFSKIMSYQLLQGETTFTLEANYNNDMSESNIPSTICHELSHIRGFNNEYEANYISFLACINSNNYEYQYSGYLMAYSYCMSDLYQFNLDAFKQINNDLSNNVKAELKNDALYWNKYKGGISDLYDRIYDKILKAGGQQEGIRSYNVVVKLLISGYGVQFS